MSSPEDAALRPLARRDGEPAFDQPWQAQVLALADTLTRRGLFSPGDWSTTLGEELRRAEAAGAPDTPETYYAAVLAALERLTAASGAVPGGALAERTEAWRRAYENTPHGRPVELTAGLKR